MTYEYQNKVILYLSKLVFLINGAYYFTVIWLKNNVYKVALLDMFKLIFYGQSNPFNQLFKFTKKDKGKIIISSIPGIITPVITPVLENPLPTNVPLHFAPILPPPLPPINNFDFSFFSCILIFFLGYFLGLLFSIEEDENIIVDEKEEILGDTIYDINAYNVTEKKIFLILSIIIICVMAEYLIKIIISTKYDQRTKK